MHSQSLPPELFTFSCYAGPDAGKTLVLTPHHRLLLGSGGQSSYQLADPYVADQHLHLFFDGSRLHFRTIDNQYVRLNSAPVMTGEMDVGTDSLQIGSSLWRLAKPSPPHTSDSHFGEPYQRFSTFANVEQLDNDFSLKTIFSRIGEKRSDDDIENAFTVGTRDTTPPLASIAATWPQPWLFGRIASASLLVFWGLYIGVAQFNNIIVIPGLLFIGAFAVPFACLIFFWEMNAPQNVSLYQTVKLLFTGGILSILISLLFFSNVSFLSSWLGASSAGIVEESGKLLTVLALMRNKRKYPWILNGLLFGAAVGTGFAAFESAGYAFVALLEYGSIDVALANIVARGIMAPFAHIIWTAITAAAVWRLKGFGPFRWELLQEKSFIRLFVLVMFMHMLWNADFGLALSVFGIEFKHILIGLLGWTIVLSLVQEGLNQIKKAQKDGGPALVTY
ncbi:RsiW-degrading membrane proteinase PrsW (M82 family) [Larkinella arboricola]|uniref:RsiW-degrading membrane proteinase PrsW (M82 family) n=1 Tax=Larkinella arboricola TaxID=643671 RepID=A0A327X7G1_LARAB|nr:PrsW family glutamic-type intramembrane protease [Larkinella arboricola]RAK02915.1 RsiW-degrading membrane proteinase PrsW (M82 family) [Larkinella arboricola]